MYRKNHNPAALRSRHLIADALCSLMKRGKPFSQITVTEICKEAAVGRKTFYRNFMLREDVMDFQLDFMRNAYQAELASLPREQYLYHHFAYIQENADFFIALYHNGLISMANEKFSTLLPDTMPLWSRDPIEQDYRSACVIGGIEAIQRVWISRGCTESIHRMVEIAQRCQAQALSVPEATP